jgi:hypothetical protein
MARPESTGHAATAREPTRPCGRAVAQWPRHAAHARLFRKGYRVTATGSVGTGPAGAAAACLHPHAQHRLRTGQSWQCQPTRGGNTPASTAARISAARR